MEFIYIKKVHKTHIQCEEFSTPILDLLQRRQFEPPSTSYNAESLAKALNYWKGITSPSSAISITLKAYIVLQGGDFVFLSIA